MAYNIGLSDDAQEDLKSLDARWRATVRKAIETHLRHEPMKISKSRIKRLREMDHPQYRLRVGEMRVFYDVEKDFVKIMGIITKESAEAWLDSYSHEV